MRAVTRRLALFMTAASAAALAAPAAMAQAAIKFTGSIGNALKRRKRIAVPAYQITYILQQQATAVAGVGASTRLNTVLMGVDEPMLRKLTDEAYADLVAKFTAAGFDVVPASEAKAITAGVELVPGNADIQAVKAGITIGKSIKSGWAAFGATDAPLIQAYHNPGSPTGAPGLAAVGANGKIGAAAKALDAACVIPSLRIDYANLEAHGGGGMFSGGRASVGGDLQFSLRAFSGATFVVQEDRGAGYGMAIYLAKDLVDKTPFAKVDEGGAGVRGGARTSADSNYILRDHARGDAVWIDPPVWEGLVRKATQTFNTALVEAAVKARG